MPHRKISEMSGVSESVLHSGIDHSCHATAYGHDPRFAGMSEHDMREFLKEEQKEGMHPSLRGKRF